MASQEAAETKSIITSLLISTPLRCTIKHLCDDYYNTVGYKIPVRKLGFSTVEEYLRSIPDTVQVVGSGVTAEVKAVVKEKSAHINQLVALQKKDAIPAHKRQNLKSYKDSTSNKPKSTSSSSQRNKKPLNFVDEYRSRVPKRIQNNLIKLIMQHPDGILCTELKTVYKNMFNENLSYEEFRYRSLMELCADLPEIFQYMQKTSDDFILYHKNRPIPSFDQNEAKDPEKKEVPTINWHPNSALIPHNIIYLSEEIPSYKGDFKNGELLDICVGEIFDINNFYMFLKYGELNRLMEEMESFFNSQKNRYVIHDLLREVGLYCVVFYQKQYHRCIITDLLSHIPGFIHVLFIDYGSIGQVPDTSIWYMPREFGSLPCQAFKARLYKVRPLENSAEQCTEKFRQMVTIDKDLVAEVLDIDDKNLVVDIYLADISDQDNIFYINDLLVERGHAKYVKSNE